MNNDGASSFQSYLGAACLLVLIMLSGGSLPGIIVLNDPLTAEEHTNLGRIYESQGKIDLAAQPYRQALKQDKRSLPALLLLGDLSYRTGNYSEAASADKKALKLQPETGTSITICAGSILISMQR